MVINDDTKIIPGHGRPSNKKELQAYVILMEEIKNKVKAAIAAGKTLEDLKADPSIGGDYDATYGNGYINPDRMREIFFKGLKGN